MGNIYVMLPWTAQHISRKGDQTIKLSKVVSTGIQGAKEGNKRNLFFFNLPVRKKATTKAGFTPEPPLLDTQHWKRPEEKRPATMKELKEKQAILEQRRK